MSSRGNRYFLDGEGIAREVVQADICRYLGNDALVKPTNTKMGEPEGFWVTAYRPLTTDMVDDLKADSVLWMRERESVQRARGKVPVPYTTSRTHEARQAMGPSEYQQTPQPAAARLQPSYEDVNRGGGYGDPSQQQSWEQAQYYAQAHSSQQAQPAQAVPAGYPPTGYTTSEGYAMTEGYSNPYRFDTGATFRDSDHGQPRALAGYTHPQATNSAHQYPDSRNAQPNYAGTNTGNPSPGVPSSRQPMPRDSYNRNDHYNPR